MTSTIKVNTVTTESGSTLTLGGCGKTVALASGASQTGFGRTGTVDWQTSIKTTGFTAVSGEGYFCDTSSGGFTLTLPASPSAGDIVAFKDYANTFDTATLTIGRNGSNIGGQAIDSQISTEGIAVTLVYADATKGWLVTDSGLQSESPGPLFISATGGTVATVCTNFKVHTFTGPGTFCVSCAGNSAGSNKVSYLVVAGGGGSGQYYGGGGGGGGFRESKSPDTPYTASPLDETNGLTVSATGFPITVGGGGAKGGPSYQPGVKGANSTFSSITSTGGGFGGGSQPSGAVGGPGGSGGGGGGTNGGAGGSGNDPAVSPAQGQDGATVGGSLAGGGGGATGVGGNNPDKKQGGVGATTSINNTPTAYAGGGGGGPEATTATSPCGSGGVNTPSPVSPADLRNGGTNKGGGGGADGGAGGSGIVIIRYKFQ